MGESILPMVRVRLDWMPDGAFVTGVPRGTWNGFADVWLTMDEVRKIDAMSREVYGFGVLEDTDTATGEPTALAVASDASGVHLFDVQPDGERSRMAEMDEGPMVGERTRFYAFGGWTFTYAD